MKPLLCAALLSLLLLNGLKAQKALNQALRGEWIKDNISLADGSTVYEPEIINSTVIYHFISDDTLLLTYNGQSRYHRYRFRDSTLNFSGKEYKVTRFEKPLLELVETNPGEGYMALKLKLVYKPTYDISFAPEAYRAKNGEPVYIRIPGLIEPKFLHVSQSAMDFIYGQFRYPEYRKGGFVVRFVITKEGNLEGARIVASSHPKYDQRLIDALQKTRGKWYPATYNGQKVNCEVEFNFDLGWSGTTEDSKTENLRFQAQQDLDYGSYYFEAKSYKNAIYYLNKVLEANPYSIDAYYKRAASYFFIGDNDSACKDYQQLILLNQKKAEELMEKVCTE